MRQRRNHLTLVALIVAALAGVALLAIPGSPGHKKTKLGLDLQGGLEVVLQAVPPKGHKITSEDLDRSVSIMRNRVDKLGVSEPEIRKQGSDQIVIELPGVKNPKQAFDLIGKTAQLELFDLEADLTGPSIDAQGFPVATPSLFNLLAGQQSRPGKGQPSAYYLFDAKKKRLLAGPESTRQAILERRDALIAAAKKRPAAGATKAPKPKASNPTDADGYAIFHVPPGTVVLTCGTSDLYCAGVQESPPTRTYYYLLRYQPDHPTDPIPEMTGGDLKLSGTRQDFDATTGQPEVLLAFTGEGRKKFREVTKAEAVRGRTQYARFGATSGLTKDQFDQHFAIVLDRDIKSTPSIDFQQYPSGIDPVNGARITGLKNLQEAKDLALVLQTGALPVTFNQLEQTQVSATLGKDSLNQAKTAAVIGLLVVALFLLLFYRFLGLIAVIGLAIYAAFLYGAILLLDVTLTLPGFAGMILTIGVAADANVVVFERIKEEVRAGKSVRAAIAAGYSKGFHTIVDANVVTAITALVLFAVATAGVKGFALMLLVGTVISLITAVAATRAMLGLLAGFRWFDNPAFMGAEGQQRGRFLQIDFMRRRYLWFAISAVVVAIGMISLGVRGLNLGIDFKGGTQITFKTPQYVSLAKVRDQTAAIGRSDAVIQGRGSSRGDAYKSFQIRTKSLKPGEQQTLLNDLQQRVGAISPGVKNVSSSFGRQIARLAILAIVVSLLLIVIYIAVRFDFKFAIPTIVSMLHDIAVTVGIYSLIGSEVSTATVAAVLTVLGYSIYDTIIIFDRVRENIPLMRNTRASFATIANVSLWETIRRSLATTFITLLPVTALLLFGGETLKTFALALLIGIASGAYSSIFIAAPLLTLWKEREPEYRRLIGSTEIAGGVGGQLLLDQAEQAAAAEEAPETPLLPEIEPAPALAGDGAVSKSQAKRERRRQRRRTRPHGRAR
ncbi:MAG TPA: protein translocase subunit SecD [Gaiellaceae bacterium]|nr:protein translocase subunit SecD [Gaiellaceae bacterium]